MKTRRRKERSSCPQQGESPTTITGNSGSPMTLTTCKTASPWSPTRGVGWTPSVTSSTPSSASEMRRRRFSFTDRLLNSGRLPLWTLKPVTGRHWALHTLRFQSFSVSLKTCSFFFLHSVAATGTLSQYFISVVCVCVCVCVCVRVLFYGSNQVCLIK